MLKLYESFEDTRVLSLRVGGPIGRILKPIINPNNLYIEGWHVEDNRSKKHLVLLSKDIREILPQGIAVDDHEVLAEENELVRLEDVIKIDFSLKGLRVTSESGKKYGKVTDFAFETSNCYVQKVYVAQPVRNFAGGTLSIDRSQIIEITNRRIIIEDPTEKARDAVPSPNPAS